jgi:hypothetical protein
VILKKTPSKHQHEYCILHNAYMLYIVLFPDDDDDDDDDHHHHQRLKQAGTVM